MMYELLKDYSNKIWLTKSCRFHAYKRMMANERYSNLAIAIQTISIIVINLLVFLPEYAKNQATSTTITIITIGLSVFVLGISLYLYARDYKTKAINYHQCGKELTELNDNVRLILTQPSVSESDVREVIEQYNMIIKSYDNNHSQIDYDMVDILKDGTSCLKKCKVYVSFFVQIYLPYILIGILVPMVCFVLAYKCNG